VLLTVTVNTGTAFPEFAAMSPPVARAIRVLLGLASPSPMEMIVAAERSATAELVEIALTATHAPLAAIHAKREHCPVLPDRRSAWPIAATSPLVRTAARTSIAMVLGPARVPRAAHVHLATLPVRPGPIPAPLAPKFVWPTPAINPLARTAAQIYIAMALGRARVPLAAHVHPAALLARPGHIPAPPAPKFVWPIPAINPLARVAAEICIAMALGRARVPLAVHVHPAALLARLGHIPAPPAPKFVWPTPAINPLARTAAGVRIAMALGRAHVPLAAHAHPAALPVRPEHIPAPRAPKFVWPTAATSRPARAVDPLRSATEVETA
jgi:hypothetical protein